jgi:hypothetical protein
VQGARERARAGKQHRSSSSRSVQLSCCGSLGPWVGACSDSAVGCVSCNDATCAFRLLSDFRFVLLQITLCCRVTCRLCCCVLPVELTQVEGW